MWDVRRKAFGGGKSGREWGLRCRCLEECGASGTELLDTENKLMVARGEGSAELGSKAEGASEMLTCSYKSRGVMDSIGKECGH